MGKVDKEKTIEIVEDIDDVMEWVFKQHIDMPWWESEDIPDEVKDAFGAYETVIKKAMEEKVTDATELIFVDILKFEAEKLEKVAKVIWTTMDIMKFTSELPTEELTQIAISFEKIARRWEKKKENADWHLTINPNDILRGKSKLVDLKMKLTKPLAYYKTLEAWFTVNRRATRSATSIAIRQFSSDMDTNIKKMLTVADSEAFWELLSSKMHMWALTAEFVYNYLNNINDSMKYLIDDMNTVVNQIKFDMRAWWLA